MDEHENIIARKMVRLVSTTKRPSCQHFGKTTLMDLCVGIKVGDTTRFLSMKAPAGKGPNKEGAWSLYDVLSNDDYHQSKLGEAKWRSLVPAASLQPNCKKEGFNVKSKRMKVRIGILGNNEDDCLSAESFIGVGGNPWHNELCGFKVDKVITVGNIATCGPDNGVKVTRGMGYILIR